MAARHSNWGRAPPLAVALPRALRITPAPYNPALVAMPAAPSTRKLQHLVLFAPFPDSANPPASVRTPNKNCSVALHPAPACLILLRSLQTTGSSGSQSPRSSADIPSRKPGNTSPAIPGAAKTRVAPPKYLLPPGPSSSLTNPASPAAAPGYSSTLVFASIRPPLP